MNKFLNLLACPNCRGDLTLDCFEASGVLCKEGILTCRSCGVWYPVTNSIPRLFVPGPLRPDESKFIKRRQDRLPGNITVQSTYMTQDGQVMVQETFGYKWTRQAWWGMEGESVRVMEEWLLPRYGWSDRVAYETYMRSKTTMLDAGCGLGREALRMARANPNAMVIGLELSRCVDVAARHAEKRNVENVFYVQADLTVPPFKDSAFDFIMCEGVLHHTPNTRHAFKSLVPLLNKGGELAFYVYKKKAPLREFADDYIRQLIGNLPPQRAWELMEPLTKLGKALADLKAEVEIPEDVEVLGIKAGKYDVQRLIYYTMFKCYWNDRLTFDENVLVNFDWYHPQYAWRHTPEEVEDWCRESGLEISWLHVEESGITARAKKN